MAAVIAQTCPDVVAGRAGRLPDVLRDARRAHDGEVRDSPGEQDKLGIRLPVGVHDVPGMCTLTRRCARLSAPATAVMSTSSAVLTVPTPAADGSVRAARAALSPVLVGQRRQGAATC